MDSEDTGPALHILDMEARLTCNGGMGDSREQASLSGQTMNVRTINWLLAPSGKGVFNLVLMHDEEILWKRLACRNQTRH